MNADHVLTLFAEANPVPDVDVVRREFGPSTVDFATLESRSGIMETEQLEPIEKATPQRRLNPAWVFGIALLMALVAVGGGVLLMRGSEKPAVGDQPTTTVTPTTEAATPTTEAAPPTTAAEATEPLDTSEPWDMVFISDSRGFGVAQAWADLIEEAEGVEVQLHDHAKGGLSLVQIREWLTDDVSNFGDFFRGEVADAEIIFVFGNPGGTGPTDKGCAPWTKQYAEPPEQATPADWAPYGDVLRDILDVVFELRAGQPTVIRVADEFAAPITDWREAGIEAVCTASWEAQAGVIREVADEYGAGTASWYDAFNGVDHDEDPRAKGYIAADGWHQSQDAGVAAQADVLHALGYDPIVP